MHHKHDPFVLPREGRITLQIPTLTFEFVGDFLIIEHETKYDSVWFVELKDDQTPCTGKETGFLYWTKVGWEANRDKIKQAFASSSCQRGTWEEFVQHADEHFATVEKRTRARMDALQNKLNELKRHLGM